MTEVSILDFVDGVTGEPILTLSGKQAKEIVKHSIYLQNVLELSPKEKRLTVPISLPHGRVALFKKLMTGQPVGRYYLDTEGNEYIQFYPLSSEEEDLIQTILNSGKYNTYVSNLNLKYYYRLDSERARAIEDVLRFFMFDDPEFAQRFIKIQALNSENQETLRRKKISQKRKFTNNQQPYFSANEYQNEYLGHGNEKALPYLNEDTIENLIEKHKNYLFGTYGPSKRDKLNLYLTRKNRNNRQARFNEQKEEEEKKLANREKRARQTKGRRYHSRENWNNYENYYNNLRENLEESRTNPFYFYERSNFDAQSILNRNLAPFHNKPLNRMSSLEFERYLRSLRKEGEEKSLPYQGSLVGNFFGNPNNF